MPVQHNVLTGADLHEPKGVAGASAGTVYRATGGGSGVWSYVTETISIGPVDLSNEGESVLLPIAQSGRLKNIAFVSGGAITAPVGETSVSVQLKTAGGVTLATATFPIDTTVKGTCIEVPSTASITKGSFLEFTVSDGGTSATKCYCSIAIEVL